MKNNFLNISFFIFFHQIKKMHSLEKILNRGKEKFDNMSTEEKSSGFLMIMIVSIICYVLSSGLSFKVGQWICRLIGVEPKLET